MKTNNKSAGFTLIELLVVIAIIALLMSILLPALSATKRQAQKTVCMTRLSQWGVLLALYAEDNEDMFFPGSYIYTDADGILHESDNTQSWPYLMHPYYENSKLKFCPSATLSQNRAFPSRSIWGKSMSDIFSGSYGLNGWICNPPEEILENQGHNTRKNWRTLYLKSNRTQIPLMADAYWFTGLPEDNDLPAEKEIQMLDEEFVNQENNHMRRFCVDRHSGKLNVLFLDNSISTISPKELWRLKWNREFDTSALLPQWPEWMIRFNDPE